MKKQLIYFFIFWLTINISFGQKSNRIISLENQLKTEKSDEKITKICNNLGYEYSDIDQKLSKFYLSRALSLAKKLKLSNEECNAYNNLGICYRFNNKLDSTKYYFEKAVKLAETNKDDKFLVKGYIALGWYYKTMNELPIALKYFTKALEMAKITKNKLSEADAYRKIADIHLNLNEEKQAFEKLRQAYNLYIIVKDTNAMGDMLGSMGYAFRRVGKSDSAIHYLNKCINIFKSINNFSLIPTAYTEIGKTYFEKKQFQKAELNFLQAIIEHKKPTNYGHDDGLYIYLGQTQLELNKLKESKKNILIGQKKAEESGDLEMQVEASNSLVQYYERIGDFKNAYFAKNKYTTQLDSISAKADLVQTNEILKKYDFEKQQRIIDKATFDQKKKNYVIITILILFSLLTLLAYSYFKRHQLKQKAQLQTAIFNQQTLATQAVLDGEERERKRIAADLHDGVGQTIMALKMNLLGINDHIKFENPKAKEIYEKAVDLATESAKEVRSISHQMMPNALIKSGLASAIREFLQNIELQNLKINLEVNNLNEPLEPTTEKVLYRVIQELVNNVIKHAQANTLNISIDKTDKEIVAKIEDNGKGFDTERPDYEGIGLKNIQDRIAYLKGKIIIESSKNSGTNVQITIPLT